MLAADRRTNGMRGRLVGVTFGSVGLLFALFADGPRGNGFQTRDPLRAFVSQEYPLGDDYFTKGRADTTVFRCVLTRDKDGIDGLALSELSIWGNRTGPWEIFEREGDGGFVYLDTRHLTDTTCLEACATAQYLASGRCRWERGWPAR
jgi:hypothetical protein